MTRQITRGDEIVGAARAWIGTPYRHQARKRAIGCDCLGLLLGLWEELCGPLPEDVPAYPANIRRDGDPGALQTAARRWLVSGPNAPEAGTVLLFRLHRALPPRHCAIATENGTIIHAQERLGVLEAPLTENWHRRIAGIHRFPQSPNGI